MIRYENAAVLLDTFDEDYIVERMRNWRNTFEIRRWCRQVGLISRENHAEWFRRIHSDPTIRMFLVRDLAGQAVGVCGLTSIDYINRRAEFSLYISQENKHKGHGYNALLALFNFGFSELNLNRIWGETFVGNKAAKLFSKIGMTCEGTRKEFYWKDGKYIDADLYSIGAAEWKLLSPY